MSAGLKTLLHSEPSLVNNSAEERLVKDDGRSRILMNLHCGCTVEKNNERGRRYFLLYAGLDLRSDRKYVSQLLILTPTVHAE
jgi:hypothetical protein